MKYLALALLMLLLMIGCGGSGPTIVPTVAIPTVGSPPPTATSPPPTWTPVPTDTPWPTQTPTPGAVITTTEGLPMCDTALLEMYVGAVAQLEAINAPLAQPKLEAETMLAAIPGLERLLEQVEGFSAPCDRALWLRQMLTSEISAEIDRLDGLASGRIKRGDPIDYELIDRLNAAVDALRQEVEKAEGPPEATPTLPPTAWDCSGDLYDCTYFLSQAEAQQCYEYCLPKAGDIHRLDEDGNGVACESLP